MDPATKPLSSIVPNTEESWRGKWFLTFDMDFAIDEVIEYTLDLLSNFNVPSTFFMTGPTAHIERIRSDPLIDVGIHPNFNPLLAGTGANDLTAEGVIGELLGHFPEAQSVRSHSLAQSSRIHQLFADLGLTHESNTFLPSGQVRGSSPWVDWSGLTRVPFHWEDDVYCLYQEANRPEPFATHALNREMGFSVFNFHPIHVFLNTESLDRYEAARPVHDDIRKLSGFRNEGYGTRDQLLELLRSA